MNLSTEENRKEEEMSNRRRALEVADDAIEQIESGSTMPDTQDAMSYALILVLADIGEQLSDIKSTLAKMHGLTTYTE